MGANQSKEELLYQLVKSGNIEGIKALIRDGARLEWTNEKGKTLLIVACKRPEHLLVAKTLIEMGANVNAYRPGNHAGTPLHHAAKRGLDSTVLLLLANGANPLAMNDDDQTPLELARERGHSNVVRAIENHICLFAGWLREIKRPNNLEGVSKKIWAVVLPCDSRNPTNPTKFELFIYPDTQVSQPKAIVVLSGFQTSMLPNFDQPDPALVISGVFKKTKRRYLTSSKFLPAREGDKQQIQWFYNACRGIYQHSDNVPVPPPLPNQSQSTNTPFSEDAELAMAINVSIQTALAEGISLPDGLQVSAIGTTNASGRSSSANPTHNHWGLLNRPSTNVGTSGWSDQPTRNETTHTNFRPNAGAPQRHTSQTEAPPNVSVPSAPPISDELIYEGGPIHYPSIDSSPVDFTVPPIETKVEDGGGSASSSSCAICLDKPVEGACIPCGHMAGCMSCLQEIKQKRGKCPVCRAKIGQIVRIYTG